MVIVLNDLRRSRPHERQPFAMFYVSECHHVASWHRNYQLPGNQLERLFPDMIEEQCRGLKVATAGDNENTIRELEKIWFRFAQLLAQIGKSHIVNPLFVETETNKIPSSHEGKAFWLVKCIGDAQVGREMTLNR